MEALAAERTATKTNGFAPYDATMLILLIANDAFR